jgi:translation initiation factor SUI1
LIKSVPLEQIYIHGKMLPSNLINPFTPNLDEIDTAAKPTKAVHVWVRQRTNRTHITTIEGLGEEIDHKKLCRALQKELNCGGGKVSETDDKGTVIQLAGDQREPLKKFLVEEGLAEKVITHGG